MSGEEILYKRMRVLDTIETNITDNQFCDWIYDILFFGETLANGKVKFIPKDMEE